MLDAMKIWRKSVKFETDQEPEAAGRRAVCSLRQDRAEEHASLPTSFSRLHAVTLAMR